LALIIFPKISVKTPNDPQHNGSKIGQASLWLIGIPLPILIFFFVVRGCTEPNLTQAKEPARSAVAQPAARESAPAHPTPA
jgi:hypothetical protein